MATVTIDPSDPRRLKKIVVDVSDAEAFKWLLSLSGDVPSGISDVVADSPAAPLPIVPPSPTRVRVASVVTRYGRTPGSRMEGSLPTRILSVMQDDPTRAYTTQELVIALGLADAARPTLYGSMNRLTVADGPIARVKQGLYKLKELPEGQASPESVGEKKKP